MNEGDITPPKFAIGDAVHASRIPLDQSEPPSAIASSSSSPSHRQNTPTGLRLSFDTTFEVIGVNPSTSKHEPHQYKIKLVPDPVPDFSLPETQLVLTKPLSNGAMIKHKDDVTGQKLYKIVGRKIVVRDPPSSNKVVYPASVKLHDAIKQAQAARCELAVAMFVVKDDMGTVREIEALNVVEASPEEQREWMGFD